MFAILLLIIVIVIKFLHQTRSVQAALLVRSAVLRNNVQDLGGEVVHGLFFSQKFSEKKVPKKLSAPSSSQGQTSTVFLF